MVSLAMAELIESSSSVPLSGSFNFDVFLSFRGEDTGKNFTGFLYKALKNRAINVFIDNEDLSTREDISPDLLKAIKGSKISILVFSKGYASSKRCLLELSHIVHCQKAKGQRVMPIFLDIEPTDVRNQTGSFAGPFEEHEKNFKPDIVKNWREALREVGNLKGWVLKDDVNGGSSDLFRTFHQWLRSVEPPEALNPELVGNIAEHWYWKFHYVDREFVEALKIQLRDIKNG
ncbi:hypothetical protein NE237_001908 [Protea cynaroides]|uniref:ADP-ribosyl cyclase/cyclic ADP-ribose hydrolase n=1 Tax=Protea cynaroides TaxID=273540 RepID=A0A9Q0KU91_9MAGN|nr:hypothetical protein NE237_001908 [Protea cynaroides]